LLADERSEDCSETVAGDEADVPLDPLDFYAHQVEEPTEHSG
jgi:hypothetical protein